MAAHGVGRSTLDLDLLTTARAVLARDLWKALGASGVRVDVRVGESDDPLAGVVRFEAPGSDPVDLIVGRDSWQDGVLERARRVRIGDADVPVAAAADLILLKLFAGGTQDAWDIEQLLASGDSAAIASDVDAGLPALSADAAALWRRVRPSPES